MTNDKTNPTLSIAVSWANEYRDRRDKGETLHCYERGAIALSDEIARLQTALKQADKIAIAASTEAVRLQKECEVLRNDRHLCVDKLRQMQSTADPACGCPPEQLGKRHLPQCPVAVWLACRRAEIRMQPIVKVDEIVRFKANNIVRYLLDVGCVNLNDLAKICYVFTSEDWDQFYQLIGYSVSGYGDLDTVSRESVEEADRRAENLLNTTRGDSSRARD